MEAKLGIPTVALITKPFRDLVQENALKKGMPNLRVTYVPSPVWGKNAERLRKDLEGNDFHLASLRGQKVVIVSWAPY